MCRSGSFQDFGEDVDLLAGPVNGEGRGVCQGSVGVVGGVLFFILGWDVLVVSLPVEESFFVEVYEFLEEWVPVGGGACKGYG